MRRRVAVDWDGTCVPNAFPEQPQEWLPGAQQALHLLSAHFDVVIFSCRVASREFNRENTYRDPAIVAAEIGYVRRMLDEAGLHTVTIWLKDYKPPAVAYVDDKGVHYNGRKGAWDAIVTRLLIKQGIALPEEKEVASEST